MRKAAISQLWHWCPQDCGHDPVNDEQLFSEGTSLTGAMSSAHRQCVLAWDERMAEHAEGGTHPHPERPDRVRAVIARLLSCGLAGVLLRIATNGPCMLSTCLSHVPVMG